MKQDGQIDTDANDAPESGFNLSRWALQHKALTRYLMIVLMLIGIASYFQLGQDEDPPFAFRAMMIRDDAANGRTSGRQTRAHFARSA